MTYKPFRFRQFARFFSSFTIFLFPTPRSLYHALPDAIKCIYCVFHALWIMLLDAKNRCFFQFMPEIQLCFCHEKP